MRQRFRSKIIKKSNITHLYNLAVLQITWMYIPLRWAGKTWGWWYWCNFVTTCKFWRWWRRNSSLHWCRDLEAQLAQVMEVTGHKRLQKVKKWQNSPTSCKWKVEYEKHIAISIFGDAPAEDEKVDQPLNSAENLETANKWPVSEKDNYINTLIWKQILGQTAHSNFNTLYDQCNGKMPLNIFEMLFNQELRIHLVHQTLQHASFT